MTVSAYSILEARTPGALVTLVAAAIVANKQPQGGVVVVDRGGLLIYTQAMVSGSPNLSPVATTVLEAASPPGNSGLATLIGGTVTVTNSKATSTAVILLTIQALGTVAAPKALTLTRSAGVSFTITSSDVTDTSIVGYQIIEPA